eukprot:TRINITY_DN4697_c0_g1_i1.p1 TRINITY_DN4697_c0_g1~~TRINITY_DN4697_c0_g1_i1.p1  ORF type:complete len:448 (-),score=79.93 TRINITY_DN4697_c0_g1_i1:600-1919(-)
MILCHSVLLLCLAAPAVRGGQLFGWGRNDLSQLGVGDSAMHTAPTAVSGPWGAHNVTTAGTGQYHTAVLAGGQLYTAGFNSAGQLGIPTLAGAQTPSFLAVPSGAAWGSAIVTGLAAGDAHTTAVAGGVMYAFGLNANGQLGLGTGSAYSYPTPQAVNGANAPWGAMAVTSLTAGLYHTLIIAGGVAYVAGTLGGIGSPTPVLLAGPWGTAPLTLTASGSQHALMLAAGTVYSVGLGSSGQLGLGNTDTQYTPQPLQGSAAPWGSGIVVSLTGGKGHSALIAGSAVYTFGDNTCGQLGLGTASPGQAWPQLVGGGSAQWPAGSPTAVDAGALHTAVLAGGQVYTFGDNSYGQLGLGTMTQSPSPSLVTTNPWVAGTVTMIVAGDYQTFAVAAAPPQTVSPSPAAIREAVSGAPATRMLGGGGAFLLAAALLFFYLPCCN